MITRVFVVLVVALACLGLYLRPAPEWRFETPEVATLGTGASFETVFTHTSPEGVAHAPALNVTNEGFTLVWFDGIRESHNDVKILGTTWPGGVVETLFTRQSVSALMHPAQTILTLGNTVSAGAQGGYFGTVVSLGGWAAASVALIEDARARKLNLSPILARSHLTKSPVVAMQGDMRLLPTYFEMEGAYGVTALIDAQGRVRGQGIMRGTNAAIQPMVVPLTETRAVALQRRFERDQTQLLASWTGNGGRTWSPPSPLDLANPSAPVAAVTLSDGRILMLFNPEPNTADVLQFATSSDGGASWALGRLLDGPDKGNLRYPMMAVLRDGRIAVTYSTHNKTRIIAHILSADWAVQ